MVGQSVLQSAKAHNSFSAFLLQICAVYFALLSSDLGWSSVLKRHLSPETFLVKDVFTKLYFFTPVSIFKKYTFWFKNWVHKFWNTICMILKDLKDFKRLFRSARTSWNTFVSPSVSLRQKSKSHLKPYKSSQDHSRPLVWNIAVKRTMSSIIPWWRIQIERRIQRQRQTKFQDLWVNI